MADTHTHQSITSKAILRFLKAEPSGSLGLKELRKKVLATSGGESSQIKTEVLAKVEKLAKRGRVQLEGKVVTRTKKKRKKASLSRSFKSAPPSLVQLAAGGHLRPYTLRAFEDGMDFLTNQSGKGYSIIEHEHLSMQPFIAPGYGGVVTTPFDEWNYVLCEGAPRIEDARSNRKATLEDFLSHPMALGTGLTRAEIVALRLMTGPMGELYNHYLELSHDSEHNKGLMRVYSHSENSRGGTTNPFSGTCRSAACAIGKLMHASTASFGELFRVIFHSEIHAEDILCAAPNRSFIEIGFMSASLEHIQFEKNTGEPPRSDASILSMVMNGGCACAQVEWLSQRPRLIKYIFPPFCSLTLTGQQCTRKDGVKIISAVVSSQPHHMLSGATSAAKTKYVQHVRGLLIQFSEKNIPSQVTAPLVAHLEDAKSKSGSWFDMPTNACEMYAELATSYKSVLAKLKTFVAPPSAESVPCQLAVASLLFSLGDYGTVVATLKDYCTLHIVHGSSSDESGSSRALEDSARCYELLAEAYEMREQSLPLDQQHFENLEHAASLYERSVTQWRALQAEASAGTRDTEVHVAAALMKFGRAKARSTNRRSLGFNDEVRDIQDMLQTAKAALEEAISSFRDLRHSFLPLALKSEGMVLHNMYRNQPGYRWGSATGPAHNKVGDAALKLYRESADLLRSDAERSLDYAESLTCCGAVFDDRGLTNQALPFRLRSAAVQESNWGRSHPASQKYRTTLASCLERLNRTREAEEVRRGGRLILDVDTNSHPVVEFQGEVVTGHSTAQNVGQDLQVNFYISHDRSLAVDTARMLRGDLSLLGYTAIWSHEQPAEAGETAVNDAIASSEKFVLLLTKGILDGQYLLEMKAAIKLRKPVILIHESDERRLDYISLTEVMSKLPQELTTYVGDSQCLYLARSDYEITALMGELCSSNGESTHGLGKSAPSSQKPLPTGCLWHFFISHYQLNSGDQCHSLATVLESMGYSIWFDQNQADLTEEGMMKGVQRSAAVILFLNDSVLTRNFVQKEIREALKHKKKVILVHEADGRHGAPLNSFGGFDFERVCVLQAPDDLRNLHANHESIAYQRRKALRDAMIQMITERFAER